jgi:hypothetical protein
MTIFFVCPDMIGANENYQSCQAKACVVLRSCAFLARSRPGRANRRKSAMPRPYVPHSTFGGDNSSAVWK